MSSTATFQDRCAAIATAEFANTTIWSTQYVPAATTLNLTADIPDNCDVLSPLLHTVADDICRVVLEVQTSSTSRISMEAWLPQKWTGRFMSAGNGAIAGCIFYNDLSYGAGLGFATVGANAGHNGTTFVPLLNNIESKIDFSYRSVHTGAVIGKQIVESFYGKPHDKAYYLGCSQGGRQGLKEVQSFPEDFDGVVVGAPAARYNNHVSWISSFYGITGPPDSESFVSAELWQLIHQQVLAACDDLDGYEDGILEDPSQCHYDPGDLLCGPCGDESSKQLCLKDAQLATVRAIYSPLVGLNNTYIAPGQTLGTEEVAAPSFYAGTPQPYTEETFRYFIYDDPTWQAADISLSDFAYAIDSNIADMEAFEGDLSAFRNRGGKLLHWQGTIDARVNPAASTEYYEHVSQTMGHDSLDSFYRYFRIAGMDHCFGGPGAWSIGGTWFFDWDFVGANYSMDPEENVLMAAVRWVEEGIAPDTIRGTKWVDDSRENGADYQRNHCRYPFSNKWSGEGDVKDPGTWVCGE